MKMFILSVVAVLFASNVWAADADEEVSRAFSILQQVSQLDILAGSLELAKGTDTDAKAHAQKWVDRHVQIEKDLKTFMTKKSIAVMESLDQDDLSDQVEAVEALKTLTAGPDFDKAYAKVMVKIHAIALQALYRSQYLFRGTEEGKFLAPLIGHAYTGYQTACKIADRLKV